MTTSPARTAFWDGIRTMLPLLLGVVPFGLIVGITAASTEIGGLLGMAKLYVQDGDPKDPLASPLHLDPSGFPPLLIHVGDYEILLDDATRFAERAKAAGVETTLEVWPEMVHVWHGSAGHVPEADHAIARIAEWLRPRIGLATGTG